MWKGLTAAAALSLGALPALAATVTATFTGKVGSTTIRGTAPSDMGFATMNGQSFTLSFIFDAASVAGAAQGSERIQDKAALDKATLSVNGSLLWTVQGTQGFMATTEPAATIPAWDQYSLEAADRQDNDSGNINSYVQSSLVAYVYHPDFLLPDDLDKPFSRDLSGLWPSGGGSFDYEIFEEICVSGDGCERTAYYNYTMFLNFDGLTVTSDAPTTSPVPLPASAWMLLAALGGMGAVTRRKQRMSA